MKYQVEYTEQAIKELKKLDGFTKRSRHRSNLKEASEDDVLRISKKLIAKNHIAYEKLAK